MNQFTGLNYVNIGGKERPIKFGTNQGAIYCQTRGCILSDYMNDMARLGKQEVDGSEMRDLIYSALSAGCTSAKIPQDFDRFDVGDWIDEADQNEIKRVFQIMTAQNSPNGQGAKPTAEKQAA